MSHCQPADDAAAVEYRPIHTDSRKLYRAGSDGSVWSLTNRAGAHWRKLKGSRIPSGHLRIEIRGRNYYCHRLILEAFSGPPPDPKMSCCHVNDVPDDNRPDNLRWGWDADNVLDALRNGGRLTGSRRKGAKIDEDDARAILAAFRSGVSHKALARTYAMTPATIWKIVQGITWTHATGLPPKGHTAQRRVNPVPSVHPAYVPPTSTD